MPKRTHDDGDDEVDIDAIVKRAVSEALKKHKSDSVGSRIANMVSGVFTRTTNTDKKAVSAQILRIAGDIVYDGTVTCYELLDEQKVLQYKFDVKFPVVVPIDKLVELHKIPGIVRTQIEHIPGVKGMFRVVMTYTRDSKIEITLRAEEQLTPSQPIIMQGEDKAKASVPLVDVLQHINRHIRVDDSEDSVRKHIKPIADEIMSVSLAQAIVTPVRIEQLQGVRFHPLIRDVSLVAHPDSDKVRAVFDFLKEKPSDPVSIPPVPASRGP